MKPATLFHRFVIGLLALAFLPGPSAPFAAAQDGGGPRTIVDAMGREVTLEAAPQRVAGLSASITELLYAVGVKPVGTTEGIDYPAEAAALPTFGSGYQLDLEALAALEPDLLVADAQLQAQMADQLAAIAPTVFVLTLTAKDIASNLRLVGQATWHDTEAEYVAAPYDTLLNVLEMSKPTAGPSVVIIVGTLDQPNYGKSSTYLGDMVALLGGTNIADDQPDAGPFPGYAQLSVEQVIEADPDLILTITRGAPGTAPMPDTMKTDPVWSTLTAVQGGHVYELDNRLFLESPGPRFTQAILQLRDIFYGTGM